MRTTILLALCAVLYVVCGTAATAVCSGASVGTFGAKGDGHTDDTAAIQSAINATGSAGGGSVVFNVARYFTTGTLQVPAGVVLCGSTEGPFDVAGSNPGTTTIAPTLLVTNSSGPFVNLQGIGAGVTDLLFHYPKPDWRPKMDLHMGRTAQIHFRTGPDGTIEFSDTRSRFADTTFFSVISLIGVGTISGVENLNRRSSDRILIRPKNEDKATPPSHHYS